MVDDHKYSRPEGQQRRRDAYGAIYDDALGTIVPPEMGARATQGPEGQLWQGIQQQQAFGAAQAGRRGYDPSMARGAAQAGAELESQGYGAAQGIREQQAAYARQAKLGLLRQRGAQDAAQSSIETGQLGQSYGDLAFNRQAKDDLQAKKEAEAKAKQDAAFQAIGGAAQVVGKVMSDEKQKKNMKDGGAAADKLMESLSMPQNRAAAAQYWNTPIGYARPRVRGNDAPAAEFQRLGDENDVSDDDVIAQLQRASDENDAEATSAADIKVARLREMVAGQNERDRGIAAGDDEPNPADAVDKPVRLANGTWMMPTTVLRGGDADDTPARRLVGPMAMPDRGGISKDEARARLGFAPARAIDPRAAAYIAEHSPRVAELAQMPQGQGDGYGATIRSSEVEAKRAKAEADSQELAQFFNQRAAEFEGKARAPEAAKRAEVVRSFDDYAAEAASKLQPKTLDGALDAAAPKSFDYRGDAGPRGRQLGVTAQAMQSNPLTAAMVTPTPQGLALDTTKAVGPILGMLGQVGKRLKRVEARQ